MILSWLVDEAVILICITNTEYCFLLCVCVCVCVGVGGVWRIAIRLLTAADDCWVEQSSGPISAATHHHRTAEGFARGTRKDPTPSAPVRRELQTHQSTTSAPDSPVNCNFLSAPHLLLVIDFDSRVFEDCFPRYVLHPINIIWFIRRCWWI